MREAAGLRSPEALAQAAGVAKQTAYNWENRLTPPPPSGVQKIAKALGLSAGEVLAYHATPPPLTRLGESTAHYGLRALPTASELEATCRARLEDALLSAHGIPERLAYLAEQLSGSLATPAHWRTEDRASANAKKLMDSLGSTPAAVPAEHGKKGA